ncbi:pol polyprotein [Striga asiatica]|uniref:Pol polyprotein n=1 Tax=Striga asiatica TaxID=4170 RepID=A0A5A7PQ71_STRAF|nr:pol polyprotein [Striga asiatica]
MFKGQIGRNMEVYVDDMLVKSRKVEDHVANLRETLATLWQFGMTLNLAKCKFGVRLGKFLGYLVTERGIEVNSENVRAVMEMQTPRSLWEVQIHTGHLAGLSRFIAQSAQKSFPFFKDLKKGSHFEWTSQAQHAFERLKEFLAELPLLTKLEPGDILVIYLPVGHEAISSVLIKEEQRQQKPIYYASQILQGTKRQYSDVEKAAFALISTTRKLRPYFLAHKVMAQTNYPLKNTLGRGSASGRMVKWAVELGEYNVHFEECTVGVVVRPWIVYIDGSSEIGEAGLGILVVTTEKDHLEYAVKLSFRVSNNEAQYDAFIKGIQLVLKEGARQGRPTFENGHVTCLLPITLMDMTRSTLDLVLEVEEQRDWRSSLIQWLQEPVAGKDIRDDPMKAMAQDLVRKCKKCQQHGPLIHRSAENMVPISWPVPFTQ